MLLKYCPFTAEGLAFAIASINASKFSCNFAVVLPNGTGRSVKVLVFAKGDKVAEAEAA